jgi:hypothetical protein
MNFTVSVASHAGMTAYIASALNTQSQGVSFLS